MLTADLVQARRRGDQLLVSPLKGARRERARGLAGAMIGVVQAHVGATRGELEEALEAVEAEARDRKLLRGLMRLLLERCAFEAEEGADPAGLRAALFTAAAAARRADPAGTLDREEVLAAVAAALDLPAAALERRLYADLPETWRLERFEPLDAEALLTRYDKAQAQAVLLRAVQVVVEVQSRDPEPLRALFRKLKFHRLLWTLQRLPPGEGRGPASRHRLTIDGPCSLFSLSSRYGLQLALLLPALDLCEHWQLRADVLWGPQRQPLRYELEGGSGRGRKRGSAETPPTEPRLPDDVARLLADIARAGGGWQAEVCAEVLDLPGAGLCVPDLRLTQPGRRPVYVEVMGFWSREAVWKRIELVQAGLSAPVVFAVSQRLRVGEAALPETLPGALYVYKGVIHAKALLERVERVAG